MRKYFPKDVVGMTDEQLRKEHEKDSWLDDDDFLWNTMEWYEVPVFPAENYGDDIFDVQE